MNEENKITGGPGDAAPATAPNPTTESKPVAPLFTGMTGDITSIEALTSYTKNLESMLITRKANEPVTEPAVFHHNTPNPVVSAPKGDTFEELIYTDPLKAKQVLKQEWASELQENQNAKDRQVAFWGSFYQKNSDLKDFEHIVQSVFKRDAATVGSFKTNEEVEKHLAREARSLVDLVKEKIGVTETRVESKRAVSISSTGEPTGGPKPPAVGGAPISFIDQVAQLRRRKA